MYHYLRLIVALRIFLFVTALSLASKTYGQDREDVADAAGGKESASSKIETAAKKASKFIPGLGGSIASSLLDMITGNSMEDKVSRIETI
jgi:hypothetical protein